MFKLRNYQQEAVDKTISYFRKSSDPAVIVLPTGAGKSLVIAELAKMAKGRVLVLTHVKELVEQNHLKYESYNLKAGVFSAGLNKKQTSDKVIFGSIQSVARASNSFFKNFNLLIIDECHRVSLEEDTQYQVVINKLKKENDRLCILGLTATPYRLGLGWLYQYNHNGELKTQEKRFFKNCIFELPLEYMIKNKFLTRPIKIDIPVTCYDFSELTQKNKMYSVSEIEDIIKNQKRLTPLIIKNIIDITESYERKGAMIFSASVSHAKEILSYFEEGEAQIILGDTEDELRDQIIGDFKKRKFKYLINVSVLTTGFDAPHVDVVAILRPTESVSLYQQIIGRGLRLDEGKKDCFILDYAGMGHDIFQAEISDKKPTKESVPVIVDCPKCGHENNFWGRVNIDGEMIEHFGRKCRGGEFNEVTMKVIPCGYRFRHKICHSCGEENDVTARECPKCNATLIDADSKLKQARLSKNAHVLKPDSFEVQKKKDKNGNDFLEIKYYDFDSNNLREVHYLNNSTSQKKFNINFLRSHIRRPELEVNFTNVDQVIKYQKLLRVPAFIIARKQDRFWRITEKIFVEEL